MCASSTTPNRPAATEPKDRSRSAVNGIATFGWNGTDGQLPSRRLQRRIAEHHGGRPAARSNASMREIAGEMRHAVLHLGVDVAGDRPVGDLADDAGNDQQIVGIVEVGGQRDRRAHAHAGKAQAGRHQPRLEIGCLDALPRPLPRRRRRRRWSVPSKLACMSSPLKSSDDFSPPASVPSAVSVVCAAAGHAERQRRQAVERHQRAGIRILAPKRTASSAPCRSRRARRCPKS